MVADNGEPEMSRPRRRHSAQSLTQAQITELHQKNIGTLLTQRSVISARLKDLYGRGILTGPEVDYMKRDLEAIDYLMNITKENMQ